MIKKFVSKLKSYVNAIENGTKYSKTAKCIVVVKIHVNEELCYVIRSK